MTDPFQTDSGQRFLGSFDPLTRDSFLREYSYEPKLDAPEFEPFESNGLGGLSIDEPEASGWFSVVQAAAAMENISGRIIWNLDRTFGGARDLVGNVYRLNADGELSTEFDIDQYITENADHLRSSAGGRRILSKYQKGDYDRIDDAGDFMRMAGFDLTAGEMRDTLNRAEGFGGFTASLAGSFVDPLTLVGASYISKGVGLTGVAKTKAGLSATRNVLSKAGRAVAVSSIEAVPINLATETGLQILDSEREIDDYFANFTANYLADVGLTLTGRGAAALGKRGFSRLSKPQAVETMQPKATQPLDRIETAGVGDIAEDIADAIEHRDKQRASREGGQQQLGLFDEAPVEDGDSAIVYDSLSPRQAQTELSNALGTIEGRIRMAEAVRAKAQETGNERAILSAEKEIESLNRSREATLTELQRQTQRYREELDARPAKPAEIGQQLELFGMVEASAPRRSPMAGEGESLVDQVGRIPEEQRSTLSALVDPETRELLNNIVNRMARAQEVDPGELQENMVKAMDSINKRQGNLRWNPASFNEFRAVPTVKLQQAIEHAEIVGFVPTTPLEDVMMALKQMGFGDESVRRPLQEGDYLGGAGFAVPKDGGGFVGSGTSQGRIRPDAEPVPPELRARFGQNSVSDHLDLLPDVSRDKKRELLARATRSEQRINQGPVEAANSFLSRVKFAYSDNPVISSVTHHLVEANYTTKAKVDGSWRASPPAERVERTLRGVAQVQEAIIFDAFIDFARKLKLSPAERSSLELRESGLFTDTLHRKFLAYSDMVERLRVERQRFVDSMDPELGGGTDADAMLRSHQNHNAIIDEYLDRFWPQQTQGSRLAAQLAVAKAEERLGKAMAWPMFNGIRASADGGFERVRSARESSPTYRILNRLQENSTSMVLHDRIPFQDLIEILRMAQDLPDDAPIDSIFRVFSMMTDGTERKVSIEKVQDAIRGSASLREEVTRNVVRVWNERLLGIVPMENAAEILEQFPNAARLDAFGRAQAHAHIASRYQTATNLMETMMVLQRLDGLRRNGNEYRSRLFSEQFAFWTDIERLAEFAETAQEGRLLVDQVETFIHDAKKRLVAHAEEFADVLTTRKGDDLDPAQRRRAMDEAKDWSKVLDAWLGLDPSGETSDSLRRLAGRNLVAGTRNAYLGRVGLTTLHDAAQIVPAGMSGPVKSSLSPFMRAWAADVAHLKRQGWGAEDFGYLIDLMSTHLDTDAAALSRRFDIAISAEEFQTLAADMNRTRSKGEAVAQGFTAFNERVVPRAIGRLSGFNTVIRLSKNAGVTMAFEKFFHPKQGFLIRMNRVLSSVRNGTELNEALKVEGFETTATSGQYSDWAFIRNYLSEDDIGVLAERVGDSRKTVELRRRFGLSALLGDQRVEVIEPKDLTPEELGAFDRLAMLLDAWVENRVFLTPGKVDSLRFGSDRGTFNRATTMFLRPALASSRKIVNATGNGPMAWFFGAMLFNTGIALTIDFLRAAVKGRDEEWLEEFQTPNGGIRMVSEAMGFVGYTSALGEKILQAGLSELLADNLYKGRRGVEFATQVAPQSFVQDLFSLIGMTKQIATGEDLTGTQRRVLRRFASFGVMDTLAVNVLSLLFDESGLDEDMDAEETFEFLFPEFED